MIKKTEEDLFDRDNFEEHHLNNNNIVVSVDSRLPKQFQNMSSSAKSKLEEQFAHLFFLDGDNIKKIEKSFYDSNNLNLESELPVSITKLVWFT